VAPFIDKMRENRLKLFSHVVRRGDLEAMRMVMEIYVEESVRNRAK